MAYRAPGELSGSFHSGLGIASIYCLSKGFAWGPKLAEDYCDHQIDSSADSSSMPLPLPVFDPRRKRSVSGFGGHFVVTHPSAIPWDT